MPSPALPCCPRGAAQGVSQQWLCSQTRAMVMVGRLHTVLTEGHGIAATGGYPLGSTAGPGLPLWLVWQVAGIWHMLARGYCACHVRVCARHRPPLPAAGRRRYVGISSSFVAQGVRPIRFIGQEATGTETLLYWCVCVCVRLGGGRGQPGPPGQAAGCGIRSSGL